MGGILTTTHIKRNDCVINLKENEGKSSSVVFLRELDIIFVIMEIKSYSEFKDAESFEK